jgi:hypothetical protein
MHAESEIRIPLILGQKSYRQITDDIIAPIEGKAARGWYTLTTICALCFLLGLGHYQLRLVDWYWSRWYTYLSRFIIIPSKMAHGH